MGYKTLQLRRDTAADWTANNPTLLEGEIGYETDTTYYKVGDGATAWTSLAYRMTQGVLATSSPSFVSLMASGGNIVASAGELRSGVEDTVRGYCRLYGQVTGQVWGGSLYLEPSADYDTSINAYLLSAYEDDFIISNDTQAQIFSIAGADNSVAIKTSGTNSLSRFSIIGYNDQPTYGPEFIIQKSNSDTLGTLAETQDGDELGTILFSGVTSTPTAMTGFKIRVVQAGASGAGLVPANAYFETCTTAVVNSNQLVLSTDGYVGINTAVPTVALDITGACKISSSLTVGGYFNLARTTDFVGQIIIAGETNACRIHTFSHPTGNTAIPTGWNLFLGAQAGNFTTGSTATAAHQASNLVGLGAYTLCSNTVGYANLAIGAYSLYYNTSGYSNVAVGTAALQGLTTGYDNLGIGAYAGTFIYDGATQNQTSDSSIYIGSYTKALASGDTNEIVIGGSSVGLGSNTTVLGNTSTTTTAIGGTVQPITDNTYYLGRNDDDSPKAWKGVIVKDTTNGKYYRIECISGVVTATDLTD